MSDSDHDSRPASPISEGSDAGEEMGKDAPVANPDLDMGDDADKDSEDDLSDLDEAEFAEFDPTTVALEERPVDIDEDVARTLKASKSKIPRVKKPKEGKREKKRKTRREEDEDPDGQVIDGKRTKKTKSVRADGDRAPKDKPRKAATPENEELLTPDERRRRALDKAMDAALKNPNKRRRKKDEVDLEEAFDDEIAALKVRMEQACESDNRDRLDGKPALHKLKMLPEVIALLNRNTVQHTIVDPDTNFLQSVRFFLEPLSDGSLPAYQIQRDIFASLTKLPIEKESLLSSGIGKVVLYYTKSRKPEIGVKRIAERLLGEWSRPILKRSDDYKKRKIESKEFDHQAAQLALRPSALGTQSSQIPASQRIMLSQKELERERLLAQPIKSNRARLETANTSYTVAPKSTFDPTRGIDASSRPIGAGGMEAFRKMTAKQGKKRG